MVHSCQKKSIGNGSPHTRLAKQNGARFLPQQCRRNKTPLSVACTSPPLGAVRYVFT
jgi:hypothetical protein